MLRHRGLFLVIAVAAMAACSAGRPDEAPPIPDFNRLGNTPPARDYGNFVRAERPPPSISGGSLAVSRDGTRAYAADSDRDRVYVVDLVGNKLLHDIALKQDDEPGRVVEDGKGTVHVSLRRGGAIVSIDPVAGTIRERRSVCALPRGLAWDAEGDKLHVACAGGELVTMDATGAATPRVVQLGDDLRDVVVQNGHILVTRFRSGDTLYLDRDGKRLHESHLRPAMLGGDAIFDPAVAWRMRAIPSARAVAVVHQRGGARSVSMAPGGYSSGGECVSGIVHSAITIVKESGEVVESGPIAGSVLPVDIAVSADGTQLAVVNAGNWKGASNRVQVFAMSVITPPKDGSGDPVRIPDCLRAMPIGDGPGAGNAVAVEYDSKGTLVVQTREPATLEIYPRGSQPRIVTLSTISVEDTGHDIFHLSASVGGGVACASCHPEGGDDGRTWVFQGLGRRRTQTLRGGIMQTAPFHWAGDETNITALMNDVFARRMQGGLLSEQHIGALAGWLDSIPALPRAVPIEPSAADRGKDLFNGVAECSSCHYGSLYTNHQTVNVGTGGPFQVPVLAGIRFRSPFMHDGCAKTLLDRFDPVCGGGDAHGKTSQLSQAQLTDLVAYLQTL